MRRMYLCSCVLLFLALYCIYRNAEIVLQKKEYKMADAKVNYTADMVTTATVFYAENGNEGMAELAVLLGRSVRSVRAKLVREGVYVADVKPEPKAKDDGPTKAELLEAIEAAGFDADGLKGATSAALARVLAVVST
jgi:hypothetical protein